jgi:hypothetical protein
MVFRNILVRNAVRITLPCLLALASLGGSLAAAPAVAAHGTTIHVVKVTAHDNGSDANFHGYFTIPSTVPTGLVEFHFKNEGTQDHMAQFFKLNPGVSESQFLARLTPLFSSQDPSVITHALHELLEISAAAGGADSVTPGVTQSVIERVTAGHYVVVCFDTTSNGTPHFLLGMHKSFWATKHAWAAVDQDTPIKNGAPVANGTVYESDHSISVPRVIRTSQPLLLKVKVSDQTHEFQLVRVPAGTTKAALLQCLTGPQSSCSLTAQPIDSGGAAAIAPGSTHWVELNLAPGTYAAWCFVPDIVTGMPHAFMGMITVFTVTA